MSAAEESSIPGWAADLRVSVAEIRGRVEQIPEISRALEELRANTVPMQEHVKLMADVEELKVRDLGARSDWSEMLDRVPKLWEERAEWRGSLRVVKWSMAVLSLVVALLTAITLLHDLGLSIQIK
jgi:hypothetical protein